MTYTPDYTIKTEDAEINLLFNSWTFREYSKKKGIDLDELFDNVKAGKAFKSSDMPDLLLVAAQSFCKFNSKECSYNDLDACMWVDSFGGFTSFNRVEIYKVFVSKLLNLSPEQFEVIWQKVTGVTTSGEELPEAEKKSLTTEPAA